MNSVDSLDGLKKWKTVSIKGMEFAARHFKSFLPPEGHESFPSISISVGVPYMLWDMKKYHALLGILPPNNRYYPPKLEDDHAVFYTLLSMFHPRPFLLTRFGPHGAVACVRAYNDQYLDIVFRLDNKHLLFFVIFLHLSFFLLSLIQFFLLLHYFFFPSPSPFNWGRESQ